MRRVVGLLVAVGLFVVAANVVAVAANLAPCAGLLGAFAVFPVWVWVADTVARRLS